MTIHAGENMLAGADTPVIYNLTLTIANTEYSQTLPNNVRKLAVRLRNNAQSAKMAFASGTSGTAYITIDNLVPYDDMIGVATLVLYFQSPDAGAVMEITAWS